MSSRSSDARPIRTTRRSPSGASSERYASMSQRRAARRPALNEKHASVKAPPALRACRAARAASSGAWAQAPLASETARSRSAGGAGGAEGAEGAEGAGGAGAPPSTTSSWSDAGRSAHAHAIASPSAPSSERQGHAQPPLAQRAAQGGAGIAAARPPGGR